jgi:ATP-dependent Lon protease
LPDGNRQAWAQGQRRIRITGIVQTEPYIKVTAVPVQEPAPEPDSASEVEAHSRAVLSQFERTVQLSNRLSDDAYVAAVNMEQPGGLADFIASALGLEIPQQQALLEVLDPMERLQQVSVLLAKELDVLELQRKIQTQVQSEVDKSQREYYLREQIKALQRELGESDPQTRELDELRQKIESSGMPEAASTKAKQELDRLAQIPVQSPETGVIRTYVDWLVSLPGSTQTEDNLDLVEGARVLDANHYGLGKVKERILEFLAVRKLTEGRMRSPILCFVGAPGVGKTSLGRSIAQALGRKFVRMSLGGIRDEAEIRGHRRTYVGALPGRIINAMRNAGTINPVFMLDEIDKVGLDFRGDPSAALLEVLDPEQNNSFSDHYLDVPRPIKVFFITTANRIVLSFLPCETGWRSSSCPAMWRRRSSASPASSSYLQLEDHGLSAGVLVSPTAPYGIIREYREAGVRNLEREIGPSAGRPLDRLRRAAPPADHRKRCAKFRDLGDFAGAAEEQDEIGVATQCRLDRDGWRPHGHEVTHGRKGQLILTGREVMRESAQAGPRMRVRRVSSLGSSLSSLKNGHTRSCPRVPCRKEGPSAGITMATALISALVKRPARRDVAMTGEITLRGRVLPIGGVRERFWPHTARNPTFICRRRRRTSDVPKDVRRDMRFVFAEQMDQVLAVALTPAASMPKAAAA